jgi:4-amino-4-deoxy-L-arabinose transferase-like glycosyltransferase
MESASTSTATSTASLRLALRRSRRLRWVLTGVAVLVVGVLIYVYLALQPASTASTQRFDQVALTYANSQIVWVNGPTVQSTQILPLRRLAAVLQATVHPHVAQDVNTRDLIRRFGANRQVALVVLSGDFNSLPPDEGVTLNGQVVVLVDVHQNRALFLTD